MYVVYVIIIIIIIIGFFLITEFAHEARYDNEFIPQPQVKEAQGGL